MSIFRSLKDGKRRALENVLEATGQSEKTIDENFEVDLSQYNELIHYISNSKQAIKSLIESQKHHFDTIIQHAGYLNDLHENNNNPKNTNYTVIFLLLGEQCESYLKAGQKLNNVYIPASEAILNHYTIQPLDELLTNVTTEVNAVLKQRELYLTDFDSYRRRIKTCQEKMDKVSHSTPVNQSKLDELQQEMAKLQNKYNNAEKNYNEYNSKAKLLLKDSRRRILAYVERHVVTSLTTQAEVFRSATNIFNSILDTMEPSQVNEIRLAIRQSTGEDTSDLLSSNNTSTTVHHGQQHLKQSSSNNENLELKASAPPLPSMPPPSVPLPPRPRPRLSNEENSSPSGFQNEEEYGDQNVEKSLEREPILIEEEEDNDDGIPVPTYAPPPPPPIPVSNPKFNPFDD